MLEIGSGLRSKTCAKTVKYKKETKGEVVWKFQTTARDGKKGKKLL